MDLKEAKKVLNWNQSQMRLGNLPDYSQNVYQSIEKVLQELDKLQKENEELRELKYKIICKIEEKHKALRYRTPIKEILEYEFIKLKNELLKEE